MAHRLKAGRLKKNSSDSTGKGDLIKKLILAVLAGLLPQYAASPVCSAANLYGSETTGEDGTTYYTAAVSEGNAYDDVYGSYFDSTATSYGSGSYGKVIVTGGTVSGSIYGGYAYNNSASSNSVTVNGGSVSGNVYGGCVSPKGTGAANSNNVTISSGTIGGYVMGGYSYNDSAQNNTVTISGGTIASRVAGGYSSAGAASSNTVEISGGTIGSVVYGGYTASGAASSNTVKISGDSTTIKSYIYGGYASSSSGSGEVNSNRVTISGGTVSGKIYGGYTKGSGKVSNNTITISGGTIGSSSSSVSIFGGYSYYGSGDVSSNSVAISGGTISGYIYGGYAYGSGSGNVSSNKVVISGGSISSTIYGGLSYSGSGSVSSNSVDISGGSIASSVVGGYSNGSGSVSSNSVSLSGGSVSYSVYGGYASGSGSVNSNSVTMTGGSAKDIVGGYAYYGSGAVSYNTVSIGKSSDDEEESESSEITVSNTVYGGLSGGSGSVSYNSVSISSGAQIDSIVFGGRSLGSGDVSNNSVTVSGGAIAGGIYGGDAYNGTGDVTSNTVTVTDGEIADDIFGGAANSGAAGANSVTISGGTIEGDVTGGYSYSGSAGYDSSDYGNSVTITGGTITGDIYGGNTKSGDAAYNSVTIEGSDTDSVKMTLNNIYGGYSETGSAAYNSVTIAGEGDSTDSSSSVTLGSSKTVDGVVYYTHIYGGYSVSGDAKGNTVSISGDVSVDGNICGGYSVSGDADGNIVYMGSDSDAENTSRPLSEYYIYGGYSESGGASDNEVYFSSGMCWNHVYGGYSEAEEGSESAVSSNYVSVSGGYILGAVYGGYSANTDVGGSTTDEDGNAVSLGNTVEISGGYIYGGVSSSYYGGVYGGYSEKGDVSYNTVKMTGGEVAGPYNGYGGIMGGYSGSGSVSYNSVEISGADSLVGSLVLTVSNGNQDRFILGGYSYSGSAEYNSVDISDGTFYTGISGGASLGSASVSNNTVTISGGSFYGSSYGSVMGGLSYSGSATGNEVEITGGTFYDTYNSSSSSAYADIYGGYSGMGSATSNSVKIGGEEAVTIYGDVYGGYVYYSQSGSASYNSVSIGGGEEAVTIKGDVYGGYGYYYASASNNSVELLGATEISGTVYGGLSVYGGSSSSNSLTVANTENTAGGLSNFSDMTFDVSGLEAGDVMLTLTSESAISLDNAVITVDGLTQESDEEDGSSFYTLDLGAGEKITLLTAENSSLTDFYLGTSGNTDAYSYGTELYTLADASETYSISGSYSLDLTTETDSNSDVTSVVLVAGSEINVTDVILATSGESSDDASGDTASGTTLSLDWYSDPLLTLESGLSYDFSDANLETAESVTISGVSGTLLAAGDSCQLIDGAEATVSGLEALLAGASASGGSALSATYSYEPASGVTVSGTMAYVGIDSDSSSDDATGLALSVGTIGEITFGGVTYSESSLITLAEGTSYDLSDTVIDVSNLTVVDSEGNAVTVTYDDSEITDGGTVYMTLIEASEGTGLSVSSASTSQSFGYTLTNEGNTLTGTMQGIVTVTGYDLVLAAESSVAVSELTLDTSSLEWGSDALLTLNDSLTYDFSASTLDISDSVTITGVEGTLLASSDSMTLLDANGASVSGLASLVSSYSDSDGNALSASYSYEPASGVTVTGAATYTGTDTDSESSAAGGLSVSVSSIDSITFGTITYSDSALITLSEDKSYDLSGTSIDVENLTVVDSEGSSVSVTYDDSDITEGGTVYMTLVDASSDTGLSVSSASTSQSFGYTLANGENSLTGTMAGVVTVTDYDLVLAADSSVAVSELTLDTSSLEWSSDALLTLNDSLAYDFTSASVSGLDETSIKTSSFLDVDASTTLIDTASATVSGLSALEGSGYSYSYSLLDGVVTVTGSGSLTVSSGNVDYTIASIDTMDFYITSDTASGSTLLTVATADLSGTAITAYAEGGSYLSEGYEVTLLDAQDGLTTDDSTTYTGTITEGVSVEYDLDVYQDGDTIVAVVTSESDDEEDSSGTDGTEGDTEEDSSGTDATEGDTGETDGDSSSSGSSLRSETKSLVETRLAQLAMLEQGADLLAGSFNDGTLLEESRGGWTPFAAMNRTSYKYSTGSYVDIDGFNAVVGVLRTTETAGGRFTYGAAFQYGSGEYDSHAEGVKARGDTEYTGGALLARHQWHSGAYADMILSRGNTEGDYKSSEILDGVNCFYKDDAPYWGASLAAGRELALRSDTTLDVYGRYLYSHIASSSARLSTGEVYDFDSTDSSRLRLGTRYSRDLGADCRYYLGLAYEYQFDGSARGAYNGMSTLSPSLEGSSGMLEAGVRFAPKGGNLTVDLGATGWTGTRKGVEGRLTLNFSF